MNARCKALYFLTMMIACVPLSFSQGTYTRFDVPNGSNTSLNGINSAGDIVGLYTVSDNTYHGFLYRSGVYTTIDYPGAGGTQLSGINDVDQIVGSTTSYSNTGFIYDIATQAFTTVSFPGSIGTFPLAIDNTGTIVGAYRDASSTMHGFELRGSVYLDVDPGNFKTSFVRGISNSGVLAGYVLIGQIPYNFLSKRGSYRKVTIPNAPSAAVWGINRSGTALVGEYTPASGPVSGFFYENNTFQQILFPGSTSTYAQGVNDYGETVGFFQDECCFHGFIWTPSTDAAKK